jgi:hypothetical protein
VHYLNTLKLYESVPATPKDKKLRAEMVSLFNMCRLMNDIAVVGMPDTVDVAAMMRDERDTGGSDGIYPTHMTDSGGNVITNPMEVNREKHGLSCSYLDMYIQFGARGHIQFTVYNKRYSVFTRTHYLPTLIAQVAAGTALIQLYCCSCSFTCLTTLRSRDSRHTRLAAFIVLYHTMR